MNTEIDRQRFFSNISYLVQQRNIKIGDIEDRIGVSTGYISRLAKDDSTTKISADFLSALAKVLNVSMDALIFYDLSAMLPTERYITDFAEKLEKQTLKGVLNWERETLQLFDSIEGFPTGKTTHPLFNFYHEDGIIYYNSHFAGERGTEPIGDFYKVELDGGVWLYLTKVKHPSDEDDNFEMYFVNNCGSNEYNVDPICCANGDKETSFNQVLFRLYNVVAVSYRSVKVSATARNTIDRFMRKPDAVDDVELPF